MKKLFYLALMIIFLGSCQNLDDVYSRLDKVEEDVTSLKSSVKALQDAIGEGKIIKSVTPLTDTEAGGWLVTFSDNTSIRLLNGKNGIDGADGANGANGANGADGADGKNGVTPFLRIDQEGYWMVSYDNGQSFVRLLDEDGNTIKASGYEGKDGVDGAEGLSVRLVIAEDGHYVIQSFYQSDPETIVDEMVTPYTSDAGRIISSMIQDDKTHVITIVMADGSTFKFNVYYVSPTSIAILTPSPVQVARGGQASVEFRVNPSNAFFSFTGADSQIELDMVGTVQTRSSYVTTPVNYKLSRVEQVYDSKTGEMKVGQYRAIIEDTGKNVGYDEMAALVLNVDDANGNRVQISSSAFELKMVFDDKMKTGLPVLYIDTPDSKPITSKEEYITGASILTLNADMTMDYQGEMKIKGRGNSTWDAPKKPYKVKFDKKQSLFGEPKDKEWVLLANYYDKAMIRTDIAYWMASNFGDFDYVPHFHFVDLILNGKYNGTYQLGDQLKIGENRVNIGNDGFLLEIDCKADREDITFKVPHIKYPINIKDPDVVPDDENFNYVKDYLTRADELLYSGQWLDAENGYKSLIDMKSFAQWYVMMELTKNKDAAFETSCYMNLTRGGKLRMGPLWDFDVAFGMYPLIWDIMRAGVVNDPEGYYIKTYTGSWIERMFSDPEFVAAVKAAFSPYYNNKAAILAHVDSVAAANKKSAIANNKLWGTLCNKNSADNVVAAEYDSQVEYIKNWISTRIDWLKSAFDVL